MDWYTLDDKEQPVLLKGDAIYRNRPLEDWKPLKTTVDGYEVSTVFLGLDHGYGEGESPILWETMIFGDGPVKCASGDDNEYQVRYTSADDARSGHQRTIDWLREQIALTDPRPAATEAADLSNDALIYQFAQEAIHALNGDTSFDRHDALHAELTRRLTAAAPPSGQVVTLDPDQAETVSEIVASYRDDVDPDGLRPDLTGILVSMHMQLAALSDAEPHP